MFVLPTSIVSRSAPRTLLNPHFNRIVERLFDESVATGAEAPLPRTPPLDVSETDTAYNVTFDVPGVSREQLKVSVEGRRISIETIVAPKATAAADTESPQAEPVAPKSLYRERGAPRYARTVSLPVEVDHATSQAKFENGVLTLTLVKKVRTGATRLAVS